MVDHFKTLSLCTRDSGILLLESTSWYAPGRGLGYPWALLLRHLPNHSSHGPGVERR